MKEGKNERKKKKRHKEKIEKKERHVDKINSQSKMNKTKMLVQRLG